MKNLSSQPNLIRTGVHGLDEVFLGGVRENNIILVEGGPGTGKTTLGLEFIYRGAKDFDENGLVVTFELSAEKLLRDAAGFGWEFEELAEQKKVKIIYTSPMVILDELQSPDGVLASEIREMGAKRILIDGLAPLRMVGEVMNRRPFRDSLHMLVEGLQRFGVTAMMTNEISYEGADSLNAGTHERFVCDTIINMSVQEHLRGMRRSLKVIKSRGQDYITGSHTLKIVPDKGIEVYRRTQSRPKEFQMQPSSRERISIGNKEVDKIMGGGLYKGSITLAVGISGTGKTVTGTQFLMEGFRLGEPGMLVTLDEHPAQMIRNGETLGLQMGQAVKNNNLAILYDSPLELELDVHFEEILKKVKDNGIKRVVIDSLAAYEEANPDEAVGFIYALATFFKNNQITAIFNYESPELLGVSQISEELKASHLVDNIILLNYVEIATKLRRAMTIPKVRGSNNQKVTREFLIAEGGIKIVAEPDEQGEEGFEVPQLPFSAYYGILARSPARRSPLIEERVANGQSLPESPPRSVK